MPAKSKPASDDEDTTAAVPPAETRLDTEIDRPSTTAPGDGPADTTDPTEQASSVAPDKGAAARAGHGTVNAVVPVRGPAAAKRKTKGDRFEEYDVLDAHGDTVRVRRNIETGESERI